VAMVTYERRTKNNLFKEKSVSIKERRRGP
jgi:hypothetical protein